MNFIEQVNAAVEKSAQEDADIRILSLRHQISNSLRGAGIGAADRTAEVLHFVDLLVLAATPIVKRVCTEKHISDAVERVAGYPLGENQRTASDLSKQVESAARAAILQATLPGGLLHKSIQ